MRPYLRADADVPARYAGTRAQQVADRPDRQSDATYAVEIAAGVPRRIAPAAHRPRDVPAAS